MASGETGRTGENSGWRRVAGVAFLSATAPGRLTGAAETAPDRVNRRKKMPFHLRVRAAAAVAQPQRVAPQTVRPRRPLSASQPIALLGLIACVWASPSPALEFTRTNYPSGQAFGVAIGDLNGDGHADIVVTNKAEYTISR